MEPTALLKSKALYDRAFLNVDFTIGAFSSLERKKRSKNERLVHEDYVVDDQADSRG
jgi:hypothetical protein